MIWHVNATAQGGGVAEMLQTLLAYGKGAEIDNRWLVLDGDAAFFAITKRLHNLLHGDPGDGDVLGAAEHAHYQEVLAANLSEMLSRVATGDLVVLHDTQTAGLVDGLREVGIRVVWRCHVGRDTRNDQTDAAWRFLRHYVQRVDAFVMSRRAYAPAWVDDGRLVVIPPSIDPYSAKNRDLPPRSVRSILAGVGLVSGIDPDGPVHFERRDGSTASVRYHDRTAPVAMVEGAPPPHDARLVVQVSRWDRLKDMAGVMTGFARMAADGPLDAHLMLVGPDVSGVSDDPEGAEVLTGCRALWRALPEAVRSRVHLVSLPMDDVDENAIVVNAIQRHATVVVQKSLVEGFGLTVTEAMWKSRPVIASGIGGIQDQITDGYDGLLISDPYDLDSFAAALRRVLDDPDLGDRMGSAAHERVQTSFLGDRHLAQYVDLFARLAALPTERAGHERDRVPARHRQRSLRGSGPDAP